jgi:hypothetical protein
MNDATMVNYLGIFLSFEIMTDLLNDESIIHCLHFQMVVLHQRRDITATNNIILSFCLTEKFLDFDSLR